LRRNSLLPDFFLLDVRDEIKNLPGMAGGVSPGKKTIPGMVLIRHVEGEGLLPELQGGASSGVCIWWRVRGTKRLQVHPPQNILCRDRSKLLLQKDCVLVVLLSIEEGSKSYEDVLLVPLGGDAMVKVTTVEMQ
jgi:hypothetical protein